MALQQDLQIAAITLPLDVVLEMLRAIQRAPEGSLSEETVGLLKIEVGYVLCSLGRAEEEVVNGLMKETFGEL